MNFKSNFWGDGFDDCNEGDGVAEIARWLLADEVMFRITSSYNLLLPVTVDFNGVCNAFSISLMLRRLWSDGSRKDPPETAGKGIA